MRSSSTGAWDGQEPQAVLIGTTVGTYRRLGVLVLASGIALLGMFPVPAAGAEPPSNASFQRTWERTDKPVADGAAVRTWMWGPAAITGELREDYVEGPAGTRVVQYFDKSRMEISTEPGIAPTDMWYVTNGLLVQELVTGRMQVGDNTFTDRAPAWINVAGDDDDPLGPTYATFATLLDVTPHAEGAPITATVNRYGIVEDDPGLDRYGVSARYRITLPGIDHRVASVFWEFMTSAGTVWEDGETRHDALFVNPFYATGYPISEAYWANVKVAGRRVDVLMQCFERRCLTYTPGNTPGWQVETGNVGRQYYRWRYDDWPGEPPASGEELYEADLSGFAAFESAAGRGYPGGQGYIIDDYAGEGMLGKQLLVHTTPAEHPLPFGDVTLSLDVRLTSGGPETYACLVARLAEDAAGTRRYALCVDGYNTLSASWESFDADGRLLDYQSLLEFSASAALASASNWNRLQIVASDNTYWFLVNGDLAGTASHDGQASGWVGFYLVSDATGAASAEFRELVVTAIDD
jgi:hypothetical protein